MGGEEGAEEEEGQEEEGQEEKEEEEAQEGEEEEGSLPGRQAQEGPAQEQGLGGRGEEERGEAEGCGQGPLQGPHAQRRLDRHHGQVEHVQDEQGALQAREVSAYYCERSVCLAFPL